jgi:hypothetical protein
LVGTAGPDFHFARLTWADLTTKRIFKNKAQILFDLGLDLNDEKF